VHSLFNIEPSLTSRDHYKAARVAALAEWRALCVAYVRAHTLKHRLVRIRLAAPRTPWEEGNRTVAHAPLGPPLMFLPPITSLVSDFVQVRLVLRAELH
jgi:hypothetical protein